MKINWILFLALAAGLLAGRPANAQPTSTNAAPAKADDVHSQLQSLIMGVQAKVKEGKTNESDFADDFKNFDVLIAKVKDADKEQAALVTFMKAQLYLEVLKNADKGAELVKQIKADYPGTKYGTNADRILDQIAKQAAAQKIQDSLAIGSACPDFSETDLDGKALSVESRRGKVLMLDFWATWCPPCRAELPNVIQTYQKHHSEGFEIIGISLDSDKDKLTMFLKAEDGMTWPQFFDGKAWGNKLANQFGVEAIPFTLLVGPDGKIIGKDLRGDDLEAAVAKAVAAK